MRMMKLLLRLVWGDGDGMQVKNLSLVSTIILLCALGVDAVLRCACVRSV